MVRSNTLARSAWWSESRWPEPGVRTISTSRPSSLKKPSSPATSKGRSWMAFIIDALTFFNDAVMAASKSRPPLFCHFLLPRWPRGRRSPRPQRSARELRTAVTVRLNVAAADQWTGVRICSGGDRERVATRPGLAVVARVDLERNAVRVRAFEVAHAGHALGKAGDDGSINGLTRAVVLQRQMPAVGGAAWSGNETERRPSGTGRDPAATGDPVLARRPAGGAVDLGVGVPERDVSDRLPGDRVVRHHVRRPDSELAGGRSERRHLLIDDHAAVR